MAPFRLSIREGSREQSDMLIYYESYYLMRQYCPIFSHLFEYVGCDTT